ncbi:MAG: ribose-phosphate pyrophosphokinase [candidate division WOR-3 bacterium]|nr:MAG: ribose-phosphate pyrophosphokinase [candidate division WOR-3 bacterium]
MKRDIKLFSGSASQDLTKKIASAIRVPVSKCTITRFADGELKIKLEENIRGRDVFIVQSTHPPAEHILELLLFLDAAKRASADRVTAVIPYFGYARQDRKDEPRVPISAKLLADLIARSGASRVLTMDLHAEQIQGYFDIPVDHLYAAPVFIDYYQKFSGASLIVVAPDTGSVKRARAFARRLGKHVPIAIVDKRRTGPNRSMVANIIGEVENKIALIYDDMLDTGGTMIDAADSIRKKGAKEIYTCVVHPLLSRDAPQRLSKSCIKELVVTDTIPLLAEKRIKKLKILSVANLLGKAIMRIHRAESISSLFKEVQA